MKDFKGKIAFITGGASGAGLGQAKVFAKAGMKVVITDVRIDALHSAVSEIVEYSGCDVADVLPLCFDLTDRKAYTSAADTVEKVFGGPPHLLIQTAGVNSFGPIEASTFDDFDWVMGVCLDHVVNGLVLFVPRMIKAYGGKDGVAREEFHVACTSSMGAFMAGSTCGPYCAAKAAANNLMYSYADALAPYGGGSTVLCPGNINSNIGDAEKHRPEHLRNTGYHVSEGTMAHLRSVHAGGIDPIELGEILKEAIESGRIIALPFSDPNTWGPMLRNSNAIIEDYLLTAAERQKIMEERMAEMMKNRPEGDNPGAWTVPEGAERFGMARKDLDYVDPNKKAK
ncbi:MAG: SDR family NAD(P)-dependent oxidoreductase [Oscillospiraceae bacterium]|nr:SDR family NAD(P)-dependent oxidoreductase [Oscillospiraceae bacterium]